MTTSHALPASASIVSCRDRYWVVMPQANESLIQLRPIGGSEEQICAIYQPLHLESIIPAEFPLPDPNTIGDLTSFQLLADAARLNLRSGASPFRCLGKLSVYPRPYQLVPLLMALRLPTVRMLIADDVGIGKTIEAGLIARELLDRQEIQRIAVLCPPQLCQQWQTELKGKFGIDAVVVRSSTAAKLERGLPPSGEHIFKYYPHIIVSLDYVKSDRHRDSFLAHCPDFVIVDEAHTCSNGSGNGSAQQQRHRLIEQIARREGRHLVMLSATPHSGIESGFLSLIGLLKPEFGQIDFDNFASPDRAELAKHFVQRRRGGYKRMVGSAYARDATEISYQLSKPYQQLYTEVYDFARNLVTTTDGLSKAKQQGRYWAALAILRCVMSSPAAAIATLGKQIENRSIAGVEEIDDELMSGYVYDPTDREQSNDATPPLELDAQQGELRKLKQFFKNAQEISPKDDRKLQVTISWVKERLQEGLNPIVWCRYIATAKYVAQVLDGELAKKKSSQVRIIAITGEQSEDEREERLVELTSYPQRLMATPPDCLKSLVGDKPLYMSFYSSDTAEVEYIGRNHPIVERLASYLLAETLTQKSDPQAKRGGYIMTDRVKVRTNLFLLRLRHLIGDLDAGGIAARSILMAEECIVTGFTGSPSNPQWLSTEAAMELLQTAEPTANASEGITPLLSLSER